MADFASLQFEMERRSILFNANTTMPDNSLLGFEGNPNSITSPSTAGETLIYNSPRGTNYLQLSDGTLWFKSATPNLWTSYGKQIDILSGYNNNTFATIDNLDLTGLNLQNQINNIDISSQLTGVSGYFQNQLDNLDLNFASQNEIDLLSGNLQSTGQNFQQQIDNIYSSGFITGIDLSNYYTKDNPSGFITGIDLSNYATLTDLSNTGISLDQKINNLSGYFNEENILEYTKELTSGNETEFLEYPFYLSNPPSSVTCSFQNLSDNVIYNYVIGKITSSGFHVSFSDVLTNTGYFLIIKIKK